MTKKLTDVLDKLTSLKFLDPACGCGNFLMVAYMELRRLEIEVLDMLIDDSDQRAFVKQYCRVNVGQFYGIEVEDFPYQIAHVEMWRVDHQMSTWLTILVLIMQGFLLKPPRRLSTKMLCALMGTTLCPKRS